jgi:hypothetical protein
MDGDLLTFNDQARGLVETFEVVNQIDLASADHHTCIRFRELRRLYVGFAIDLIDMIEENGAVLREQLHALLRDS